MDQFLKLFSDKLDSFYTTHFINNGSERLTLPLNNENIGQITLAEIPNTLLQALILNMTNLFPAGNCDPSSDDGIRIIHEYIQNNIGNFMLRNNENVDQTELNNFTDILNSDDIMKNFFKLLFLGITNDIQRRRNIISLQYKYLKYKNKYLKTKNLI